MRFYSLDIENREVTRITEPRTIREASRCVALAIGRWLYSGQDSPDAESDDGITEEEAAMSF